MKNILFIIFILCSCRFNENERNDGRSYIKCISVNGFEANWYAYSDISSLSPGKLELVKNGKSYLILSSDYLSDIIAKKDTLLVQFWGVSPNTMGFDTAELNKTGITIAIDTTGTQFNDGPSRLDKLITRHVNFNQPHHENTDNKSKDHIIY